MRTTLLLFLCLGVTSSYAQNVRVSKEQVPYSSNYVEILGGFSNTISTSHTTPPVYPIYGLSIGRNFSPIIGARVNVLGNEIETNRYVVNTNLDMLFRLYGTSLIKPTQALNLYLLGGVGLNYGSSPNCVGSVF